MGATRASGGEASARCGPAPAPRTPLPDTRYVAELIGPDVVNTMPDHTLRAFADHGEVERTLETDPEAAEQTLADAAKAGIDLASVTAELEREGVQSFCDSYRQLLDCIESKLAVVATAHG